MFSDIEEYNKNSLKYIYKYMQGDQLIILKQQCVHNETKYAGNFAKL